MIIYEVNCLIDASVERPFLTWLKGHVSEVVALECFDSGVVSLIKLDDRLDDFPGKTGFCVTYRLQNQAALDQYLEKWAPAMRADGQKQFADQLVIYRRVMGGVLFEAHQ